MKIIGIAGASGAGKNIFAGLLSGMLAGLGFMVGQDSFGAPIKWVCRLLGWDGAPSAIWRYEMQRMAVAARKARPWFSVYADRFRDRNRVSSLDMARLERVALDWGLDKFVWWLACRNGLCLDFTVKGWYERFPGDGHVHPDYLIIPDVRYPAEADFCQRLGSLFYIDGSHAPLAPDQAVHESESHLPALRARADFIIPEQGDLRSAAAFAERLIADGVHLKMKERT